MKLPLCLPLVIMGAFGQTLPDHQSKPDLSTWKASVLTLSAASALDMESSWGKYETNPILGRGTFGARQTGIKAGMVGGSVLAEWLWLRRHPETSSVFVTVNVGVTGMLVSVSIHNWSIGPSK